MAEWSLPFPAGSLIGMVHLRPLPGSPRAQPIEEVEARALLDAKALVAGGVDALMIENFGDAPFHPDHVPPVTVAAMARIVTAAVEAHAATPVGVNVLRNDALAAMSVAAACGGRFIRVNVHTGAMLTDQGILEGRADETLRLRESLGASVAVLADVSVKHAAPIAERPLAQLAAETAERGLADALIVSGSGTGTPVDPHDLRTVWKAASDTPLVIGSGLTVANAATLAAVADAAIVGTSVKVGGDVHAKVDAASVKAVVQAWRSGRDD